MNRVNQLILYVSRTIPFRSGLDGHLIRGAMAQAGSHACGAGDNTELSDLTIQTVRTTEL